jgi:LmbE family N-acetylglucosaminyl deacetylase
LLDEGYQPHTVARMWVIGLEPNLFVDITDVFDLKLKALLSHGSQVGARDGLSELLRNWAGGYAIQAGWPAGRLAEAYREIDTL